MFDPHVFVCDFGSELAQKLGSGLKNKHTVVIDSQHYVPLTAKYDQKDDTITFRAELVVFLSEADTTVAP